MQGAESNRQFQGYEPCVLPLDYPAKMSVIVGVPVLFLVVKFAVNADDCGEVQKERVNGGIRHFVEGKLLFEIPIPFDEAVDELNVFNLVRLWKVVLFEFRLFARR